MTRSTQMIESLPNPERFREVRSSQPGYTRTLIDVAGGTRMTREKNSQNDNGSRGDDSHIWGTVGVVVGGVLAFKVLSAMGVRENEDLWWKSRPPWLSFSAPSTYLRRLESTCVKM